MTALAAGPERAKPGQVSFTREQLPAGICRVRVICEGTGEATFDCEKHGAQVHTSELTSAETGTFKVTMVTTGLASWRSTEVLVPAKP